MKPRVYLINCPPGWVKTPPLALEFLKQYLRKHKIIVETLDLNNLIFALNGYDKKQWLSLNLSFEKTLFAHIVKTYPHIIENVIESLPKL